MFKLDDLKVYQKALPLAAAAELSSSCWGKRHAVVDHFRRAAESIVLNIAEGARLHSGPEKAMMADVALGSTFECAACLDVAMIKGFIPEERCTAEKARFLEISQMLVGLRRGWLPGVMKEEPVKFEAESPWSDDRKRFHHETLDVYKVGLEFVRWFVEIPGSRELSERLCREIDKGSTSIVLNVAEGNGRYSQLDHRRFLKVSAASAAKTTAYLDLYEQKSSLAQFDTRPGKEFLSRIIAMLTAL